MQTVRLATYLLTAMVAVACKPSGPSEEYLAACEGEPLRTLAQREQALTDGYWIDKRFDCISKESARQVAQERALAEAANTPEAKARRQAEFEKQSAVLRAQGEAQARNEAEAIAARQQKMLEAVDAPVAPIDINSADELRLASLPGFAEGVAEAIVNERSKGRFADWADVSNRVVSLSAAEPLARASAFGMTVNGRSLEGAEPHSDLGKILRLKWFQRTM